MVGVDFDGLPVWANSLIVLLTILMVGKGADWVVEASSRIAKRLGISELIIGLTVVAMGTSAPEFAVTLIAGLKGQGDISVGNIVGSNIFNLGFILGGCALVRAIPTSPTLLWRDGMVLGGSTLLLLVVIGWDLSLDRHDGVILFSLLLIYLAYLFRARKVIAGGDLERAEEESPAGGAITADVFLLLLGLASIIVGSHFLVDSATAIARAYEISEWVIGVTIVAAGTSAPEMATSLAGVLKKRYALSAGNVIGSDLFNLLGVLGLAGMIRPVTIDPMGRISLIALSAMVFMVLFFIRTGWRVSRFEGGILVTVALARWFFDFASRGG